MIYLILVSVFLVGCKAVEPDQQAHHEIDSESVARWVQLHKQLYGPVSTAGGDPTPNEIRRLLQEMSLIEATDSYRNGIEPFTELNGHAINHYKYLVIKFHEANLVPRTQTTITNALLLTFHYDANDCTTEYFELLEDVLETFKDTVIGVALQSNAQLQYEHCWRKRSPSKVSSDLNLSRPSDGLELITQHPRELTDSASIPSAPNASPARLHDLNMESPRIVSIDEGTGNSRTMKYAVTWSNNKVTFETKQFLRRQAGSLFNEFIRTHYSPNRIYRRERRRLENPRLRFRSRMAQPDIVPRADPNMRRVVNIPPADERGPNVRYPSESSSDTESCVTGQTQESVRPCARSFRRRSVK